MKYQQALSNQFQDNTNTTNIGLKARDGIAQSVEFLVSGGIFGGANVSATVPGSGFATTVTLPSTGVFSTSVGFVFGNGFTANAHGTTDGADTQAYALDLSTYVPGTGSQTVYIVATYSTVQQDEVLISGPPQGHPDYDPNFVPYTGYQSIEDTVSVTPTTTLPDNSTYVEIGRYTIASTDTALGALDTSYQKIPALNSLSSFVTSVKTGATTQTGAVTLSATNIEEALGFTPVNNTGGTASNLTVDGTNGLTANKGTFSGPVTVTGLLTATNLYATASDRRLKRAIHTLSERKASRSLSLLRPVSYVDKASYHMRTGFIAQEVNEIIPEIVVRPAGARKYYAMDYSRITPYLVAGWQDHESQLRELDYHIAKLEKLEKRLLHLENRLSRHHGE